MGDAHQFVIGTDSLPNYTMVGLVVRKPDQLIASIQIPASP